MIGWLSLDVTSIVQDWQNGAYSNNGFLIEGDTYGDNRFWSSEWDDIALRPKLTITWSPSAIPDQEWISNTNRINAFDLDDYFQDPDRDTLAYTASTVDNPNIDITINPDNTVSFSPQTDWFGTETVTFTADDGSGGITQSNVVTLTVRKILLNSIPHQRWNQGSSGTLNLDNYFSNPGGDFLTYSASTDDNPNINITINPDNTATFSQAPDWYGAESVVFTAVETANPERITKSNVVYLTVDTPEYSRISLKHPRMFITEQTKPRMLELKNGPLSAYFYQLQQGAWDAAGDGTGDIAEYIYALGYLYQMTGDKSYADNGMATMDKLYDAVFDENKEHSVSYGLEGLGVGFDLLYDEIVNQDKRDYFLQKIETLLGIAKNDFYIDIYADYQNYGTRLEMGLLIGSLAIYGESPYAIEYLDLALDAFVRGLDIYNTTYKTIDSINATEGAMNFDYRLYSNLPFFEMVEAWDTATNRYSDAWHTTFNILENYGYYIIHNTKPNGKKTNFGDTTNNEGFNKIGHLSILESRYQNGYLKSYIDQILPVALGRINKVFYLMWYDPSVTNQDISTLSKVFKLGGDIIMRSGWGPDDTFVSFLTGIHWSYHNHFDYNSFTIFKHDDLAIDSGHYYLDSIGSIHHDNYYSRTIAHNAITIYDSTTWPRLDNDGGERLTTKSITPPDGRLNSDALSWAEFQKYPDVFTFSELKDFESNNDYVYINSDATNGYTNQYSGQGNNPIPRASLVNRQLVYIFPDYVIVFDRVNTLDASFQKSWLLHSGRYSDKGAEPEINGNIIKEEVPNHIVEYDGDLVTITNGNGKLFSKTLLPLNHRIRKVGGAGYEFYHHGKNYPITDSAWNLPYSEPGAWRVEVEPTEARTDDLFLHVLQAGDSSTQEMVSVKLVEEGNWVGVVINDPELAYNKILFTKTGDTDYQITSTIITPKPNLTLTKSADKTTAQTGDIITYTITYTNTGEAEARNVVVSDNIPEGTSYVLNSAKFLSGPSGVIDDTTSTIKWTILSVPAGTGGSVEMRVQVAE